jgi:hypothetical protein
VTNWFRPVVPEVCAANPEGSATSSQGIRGFITVMTISKFTYFLNLMNNVLIKLIEERLQLAMCLFRLTLRISEKKLPLRTKQVTVILIKVKSFTALLHMLLVCFSMYIKSVLRYKFLILDTNHPDTIFT